MKDIKDYLHLYLWCKVLCESQSGSKDPNIKTLTGISYDDTQRQWWCYFENEEQGYLEIEFVKPILRPLSDMTEEEMKDVVLLNYNVSATFKEAWLGESGIVGFATSGFTGGGRIDLLASSPETFKYLLSKHFDLFGLIESGLAIDKTSLPT